jgi:hypothetical protein
MKRYQVVVQSGERELPGYSGSLAVCEAWIDGYVDAALKSGYIREDSKRTTYLHHSFEVISLEVKEEAA